MFKKLRTVIYNTADLSAARIFYTKATGTEPYFDEPYYVGFNINGFELGLDPDTSRVKYGNSALAYWAVDGIYDVVQKLSGLGATVQSPVHNVGGSVNVAVMKDPFGNCFGLIEGADN